MRPRNTKDGPITRRYIAEGFKEDVFNLLQQFRQGEGESLEDFMKLWRESKMSMIYMGKTEVAELYEFTNECFVVVITLLRHENLSLPVKISAMYLLYCLYGSQPLEKYKIRITLEDNAIICNLLESAREAKLWSLCLAILKLKHESAFQIVGSLTLMGPNLHNIRSAAHEENQLAMMLEQKWSAHIKHGCESERYKELVGISKEYEALKKEIGYLNLDNPNEDGTGCLRTLETVVRGDADVYRLLDDDYKNTSEGGGPQVIGARRKFLKDRQMNTSVSKLRSTRTSGADDPPLASASIDNTEEVRRKKYALRSTLSTTNLGEVDQEDDEELEPVESTSQGKVKGQKQKTKAKSSKKEVKKKTQIPKGKKARCHYASDDDDVADSEKKDDSTDVNDDGHI